MKLSFDHLRFLVPGGEGLKKASMLEVKDFGWVEPELVRARRCPENPLAGSSICVIRSLRLATGYMTCPYPLTMKNTCRSSVVVCSAIITHHSRIAVAKDRLASKIRTIC